jgi:hypothetical protein
MFSTKVTLSELALLNGETCDVTAKLQASDAVDHIDHEFGRLELRDADLEELEIEIVDSSIFDSEGHQIADRDFTNDEMRIIEAAILVEARNVEWDHDEDEPREIDYND